MIPTIIGNIFFFIVFIALIVLVPSWYFSAIITIQRDYEKVLKLSPKKAKFYLGGCFPSLLFLTGISTAMFIPGYFCNYSDVYVIEKENKLEIKGYDCLNNHVSIRGKRIENNYQDSSYLYNYSNHPVKIWEVTSTFEVLENEEIEKSQYLEVIAEILPDSVYAFRTFKSGVILDCFGNFSKYYLNKIYSEDELKAVVIRNDQETQFYLTY